MNGLKCIFQEIPVTNYIDILNSVICVEPTRDCYFKKCNFCPGIENIVSQIEETLLENNIKSLTYQQWLNTDRSSLETVTQEANYFLDNFKQQLNVLQTHNFIAKNQNKFLKYLKLNLKIGEFIVIGDFSENYTFIIQNAIQSHNWNNSQTTIHHFVIYRSDRDENSIAKFENFVIISECNEHTTEAVYLFQKRLITWLKTKYSSDELKKKLLFLRRCSIAVQK